jgi:hypothetical protein
MFIKTMELERDLINRDIQRLEEEKQLLVIGGTELLALYKNSNFSFETLKLQALRGMTVSDILACYDSVSFLDNTYKKLKFGKEIREDNTNKNNTRFFNSSDIKPLNFKDLDGKILKMTVVDNEECLLVAGIDKESNTIYMLHSEVKGGGLI